MLLTAASRSFSNPGAEGTSQLRAPTFANHLPRQRFSATTYLGHAKISNTYWYLTGVPELMALGAAKFERYVHQEVEHE